ncbi:cyclin-D5-2-like isoform X3 [Prosopis cineraria]|uniref:cyclin-D5-2-like isoform X2 n=1 Tax=Prosopis cineraria TaxID=364024 RepID=UPI00240EC725|nr:cyclin-D5-2-like isoform X2 [Prosopis cineraria]XP_054808082.1 cyclin-D5-2-like isoform X3 [Prosopis cineraria]
MLSWESRTMATSASSFSFSSLLCEEDEASILKVSDENSGKDWMNPCSVFEDEEEYIEILFKREMGFVFPRDDCSTSAAKWLKSARVDAIDWIFNTGAKFGFKFHTIYLSVTYFDRFLSSRSIDEGKHWAVQLLSMGCLSLAAKMEEQNYLFNKFSLESKPEAIISSAVDHIMAIVKGINLIDQRPSIIASAAILAASDATLTRRGVELCVSSISWGSLESEHVFSCYNLMQEIERRKVKTPPDSNLLSTPASFTDVLENASVLSSGTKRKLTFPDSETESSPGLKIHRP